MNIVGSYECQVSTTPIRKHVVYLRVAKPIITLNGGLSLHIRTGSRINISCQIENYPKTIRYVTWFKDGRVNKAKQLKKPS